MTLTIFEIAEIFGFLAMLIGYGIKVGNLTTRLEAVEKKAIAQEEKIEEMNCNIDKKIDKIEEKLLNKLSEIEIKVAVLIDRIERQDKKD